MSEQSAQRVALITGGGVRVGRALSLGAARAGYDVIVHYNTSEGPAREVAEEIRGLGREAETVGGDLSEARVPEAVVSTVRERFGRLDLLVNSAATFAEASLLEVDAEAWDAVMDVNVRAPHLLVRAAAELLAASEGSVVNIVDLSAWQPWTEYPHHAVSKAALAHLTRVQARALAPRVRVNAVAPGAVLPPEDYPRERWEALAEKAPLKRVGSPEDVVEAVLFLAGAGFVTGQVLAVDGGRHMGPAGPPQG